MGLTKAFPSLESLTIDHKCKFSNEPSDRNAVDGHRVFQWLGRLENFHTLEFDCAPYCFKEHVTTALEPAKLVRLTALSKLHMTFSSTFHQMRSRASSVQRHFSPNRCDVSLYF